MSEDYGTVREDELDALSSMLAWSFGLPHADAEPWLRRGGLENVRVLRRGGAPAATLLLIDHAQFFGGKRVPAMGIAGVATPAATRGDGAAKAIMMAMLRELHARGVATSNLYPATLPLYRRVGYECAGSRFEVTVPLKLLVAGDRALPVRPMTSADDAAIEACYRAQAARVNGQLDRGAYVWQRVRNPRGETTRGFVVGEGSDVDGYVILFQRKASTGLLYSLVATDLVARTPAAARRLLTFLADHGTLADTVTWFGGLGDAFVPLVPALGYSVRLSHPWMTRVVDVAAALGARGYPEGMRGAIDLEISDDVISANEGRWRLHVEDGRGEAKRDGAKSSGSSSGLRMHARALAPLMTGHATPHALAASGQLEGADADLAKAAALFAAPSPWMSDFF